MGCDGVTGGASSGGVRGRARHLLTVFIGSLIALATLATLGIVNAAPARASTEPSPVLYFVHLGDIWRYDADAGEVAVAEAAGGRCLGHVSWSVDGEVLAWEERTRAEGGVYSRVVMLLRSGSLGAPDEVLEFPDAAAPAVSPDGRYLLYETRGGDEPGLVVFDTEGGPVPGPIPGAQNGSWLTVAGGAGAQVAFDRPGEPSSVEGYFVLDLSDGRIGLTSVPSAAPAADVQCGRWNPLGDGSGQNLLVTRFAQDGRRQVVLAADGAAVLDVTNADHFDYRWLHASEDGAVPALELAPLTVGRSDIHIVRLSDGSQDGPSDAVPILTLLDSSFGWNASLPAASPFPDLQPGDAYYEAAALLWSTGIVGGFPDGGFRADEPVKRAQFAKMLAGAAGVEVYRGLPIPAFPDVRSDVADMYPAEYVAAARSSRLVNGYPDGLFRPWADISRAQMVTMVVRAARGHLQLHLSDPPSGWTGETSTYRDSIHGGAVHLAEYAGLLQGIDLRAWDPRRAATRGEVAQLLANLQRLRGPLADPNTPPAYHMGRRRLGPDVDPLPRVAAAVGTIVFDGDSLTAGSTATYPYPSQVMAALRPDIYWVNFGIGGQKLTTMLENAPSKVDPLCQVGLGRNVVVIWGGTNDMRWWNHAAPVVYKRLREYCLGRRAQGFTVVTMTMLPRTDGAYPPGFESERQSFNAMVRAGWAGFADVLVDVGSDPLIGRAGCEADSRFFSGDHVHLNNMGLAQVAGRMTMLLGRIDALAGG